MGRNKEEQKLDEWGGEWIATREMWGGVSRSGKRRVDKWGRREDSK